MHDNLHKKMFIANSLGGWHKTAITQFRKLGSALSKNTGTEESICTNQIFTRGSVLIQKGLAALILNCTPNLPPPSKIRKEAIHK